MSSTILETRPVNQKRENPTVFKLLLKIDESVTKYWNFFSKDRFRSERERGVVATCTRDG